MPNVMLAKAKALSGGLGETPDAKILYVQPSNIEGIFASKTWLANCTSAAVVSDKLVCELAEEPSAWVVGEKVIVAGMVASAGNKLQGLWEIVTITGPTISLSPASLDVHAAISHSLEVRTGTGGCLINTNAVISSGQLAGPAVNGSVGITLQQEITAAYTFSNPAAGVALGIVGFSELGECAFFIDGNTQVFVAYHGSGNAYVTPMRAVGLEPNPTGYEWSGGGASGLGGGITNPGNGRIILDDPSRLLARGEVGFLSGEKFPRTLSGELDFTLTVNATLS